MLSVVLQPIIPMLFGALSGPAALIGLATLAAAGLLLVLVLNHPRPDLADPATSPTRTRAIALRERSRHSVALRLRDPDAAGRTRPRAPGWHAVA